MLCTVVIVSLPEEDFIGKIKFFSKKGVRKL